MSTIYTHRDANIRKTWALMSVFFIVIIALGWAFRVAYNAPEVLYVAVFISIFMNFASYWWSDKIALAVSGARAVEKSEAPDLYNVVENLSITAGLPIPRVYVIDDPAPNAFATGRDPAHAAVAVTTGLLATLERSELEGVIAHELSHIGNRDILVATVVVVLVGLIALLSDLFLRMSHFGGRRRDSGGGRAHAFLLIAAILLAILSPIIGKLIQLAISRKREFLADASGALLTRYPEGLASALRKISAYGRPMVRANHATAHLFIASPFGAEGFTGFMNRIFSTHPPAEERIKALLGEHRV
ncbi:MAG: hypothetical protein G01um101472_52 [Parcubacteria group bacterium Gr01-1014_72]|nr:MAG: hypothetical protein G01um101472_52 [Parcubacteria group bacterium Gr01-1014_72]